MHNALDMLNVCIAPTRLCNLGCTHCYVKPELLRDKAMMDEGLYRKTFDSIEALFKADRKVTKINIELLGGELTMMPLAYWERNLPWTLEVMAGWERDYNAEAALIWCTNLIFKDPGYISLLNEMGHRYGYGLDVFVPWEPDTNRFLKDDKLLPRYFKTLEAITGIKRKTLCITMSKAVIERGPKFIVEEFVSRGITDITCDMLYPAGSGKSYFLKTCTYGEVSDYILALSELVPDGVTISPLVEMETASVTATHFHYPGNDSYDLEVEQNGEVTFNSSYTGDEAIQPTEPLSVQDLRFAEKAIFNNAPEMLVRHSMPYEECGTCEFAVVCSGGWAWHKNLHHNLRSIIADGDCPGLKRVWLQAKANAGAETDRSKYLAVMEARKREGALRLRVATANIERGREVPLIEDSFAGAYDSFFNEFDRPRLVEMMPGVLFGKSWAERLFFYDAIGAQIDTPKSWYADAAEEGGEELFRHIVFGNYQYLAFDPVRVISEIRYRQQWKLARLVENIIADLAAGSQVRALLGGAHLDEVVLMCREAIAAMELAA